MQNGVVGVPRPLKGEDMKRIILSALMAVALLTGGVMVSQYDIVGMVHAEGDGGDD